MARNYPVIKTVNNSLNGSEVLQDVESFIGDLQIPFIEPVNLSGYASKNWNSTNYSPNALSNVYTSNSSDSSIQFTENRNTSDTKYTFDLKFNQSNGDQFTFLTAIESSGELEKSSTKEKNTLIWKYLGSSSSVEDDYYLKVDFGNNANKINPPNSSSGSYRGEGPFLLEFKTNEVIFNLSGSWLGKNEYDASGDTVDQEIHLIKRFSYENLKDKFSLVFSGKLTQDYLANTETAELSKVTFTIDGVKYDSSNFYNVSEGAGFFMRDQLYPLSEEYYVSNYFLPAALKENNVITGTSNSDTILGSQGNDRINGGAGEDTLNLGRFNWTLNDGDADSYSVSGNEKSFTITHQDNGKTHTMAVSNVELVQIGGATYSVEKFLNPNAVEITGGYILEQLYIERPDYLPGVLLDIDMSEFANQDWSKAVLKPDATKNNLSFKTNSSPPSTLTLMQNKTAETAKGFKDAITVNFSSSAGDKLTFKSLEEEINSLDASNNKIGGSYKDSASIIWNYVGDQSTQADNISINYVSNINYSDTANTNNTRTMIATSSTNLNYSDVQYKLNGSLIYKSNATVDYAYDVLSDSGTTLINKYSFQDLASGFNISFSGSVQNNYSSNETTISLKNMNASTPDISINSKLIQSNQNYDVILGLTDGESLAEIENSFLAVLDELVLSASNVIIIKNKDGFFVNAGGGNDKVTGGIGDDVISGGKGKDTLSGGQGADIFVISGENLTDGDVDVITDFNVAQGDKIYFDTSTTGITFDANTFAISPGLKNIPSAAEIIYDSQRGSLYYDADGSGSEAAILIASFSNKVGLTSDSFMSDE